ncbi:MAG: hypothetical protein RIR95_2045 [Pseudomonadota bacterium]
MLAAFMGIGYCLSCSGEMQMGAATIQQMTTRVAQLMEKRFGIRASTLQVALRKAGRRLPKKVHAAAKFLAQAEEQSKNAKLLMQLNEPEIANAYDVCVTHLNKGSLKGDRRGQLISAAATLATIILLVGVALIALLRWRGYL